MSRFARPTCIEMDSRYHRAVHMYTGVGPFPRLVEDAAWVRACAKLIEEEGPQQFLVNLLYVLREWFQEESSP